jgi:predicted  nucleic acid-binding Zn-ribbon protein
VLKKLLYERKKVTDETQVVILNEELNQYQRNKIDLSNKLDALKKQLSALQNDIVTVDKTRKQEMHKVE